MSSHPQSSILHPHAILVRGVNWLGDAVMTTPALLRLRERFPEAHIALLSPAKLRGLWLHHPAVDKVISFTEDQGIWDVVSTIRNYQMLDQIKELVAEMPKAWVSDDYSQIEDWSKRREKTIEGMKVNFNLALVLPNSPRSALEVWSAGIPQRIGYARPWRNIFLTTRVPSWPGAMKMQKRSVAEIKKLVTARLTHHASRITPHASAHHIHEYLHLVSALGANPEPLPPELFVSTEEVEAAKRKFSLDKITNPIFGLNPGAEYGPAKRWPVERFIAAAHEIQQRTNCIWLIFGGKGDTEIAIQIESALRTPHSALRNLSGQTSLRELMSLLKLCRVLLTNDSGPMHVASALGTPVVVPFGSTSPELTGPGLPGDAQIQLLKSDAPCSPCFLRECPIDFRCMKGISVERVVAAVLKTVS